MSKNEIAFNLDCITDVDYEEIEYGPLEAVCELPSGYTLYRRTNGVGGYEYFSDEIGGGVFVWNTTLVDGSTLMAAICDEIRLRHEAARKVKG